MELIFCGKRVARTVFVLQKYSHISVILWGYVLIWYACGECSVVTKKNCLNSSFLRIREIEYFFEV